MRYICLGQTRRDDDFEFEFDFDFNNFHDNRPAFTANDTHLPPIRRLWLSLCALPAMQSFLCPPLSLSRSLALPFAVLLLQTIFLFCYLCFSRSFSTLLFSCNLFFSYFVMRFNLFSLRFHFLFVCQKFIDLWSATFSAPVRGRGVYIELFVLNFSHAAKQLSHFLCSIYEQYKKIKIKFMSNIPRAMPKICRKQKKNQQIINIKKFYASRKALEAGGAGGAAAASERLHMAASSKS